VSSFQTNSETEKWLLAKKVINSGKVVNVGCRLGKLTICPECCAARIRQRFGQNALR